MRFNEGKAFLNMAKNSLGSFTCFPSLAGGLESCLQSCLSECVLWSCVRMFGLQGRERSAMYWSIHGVLIHTLSPICVSCCQNAVSEIVERLESVPPEEQKTLGRDVRAWTLYPINYKVVMEKETCLTLSHRGQLPLTDTSHKDVIFGSEVEEATLRFWSHAWPALVPTQIFSSKSPVLFLSNELLKTHISFLKQPFSCRSSCLHLGMDTCLLCVLYYVIFNSCVCMCLCACVLQWLQRPEFRVAIRRP